MPIKNLQTSHLLFCLTCPLIQECVHKWLLVGLLIMLFLIFQVGLFDFFDLIFYMFLDNEVALGLLYQLSIVDDAKAIFTFTDSISTVCFFIRGELGFFWYVQLF